MPNWCSNALVIRGGLDSFRRHALRSGKFQFTYSVPMPEALEGLHVGNREIEGETVQVWRDTPEGPLKVDTQALRSAYGHDNWYDWSRANWGTKWDLGDEARVEDRGEELRIWFDTAWSPPFQWLKTVLSRYPEWSGEMAYAEGGMGFWGVVQFGGGLILLHDHFNEGFWEEVEEENEEGEIRVSDAVDRHLQGYGLHEGG